MKSLLDASFKYVPCVATDIQATWRKLGWRPTNELPFVRPVVNSKSDKNKKRNNQTVQDVRQ